MPNHLAAASSPYLLQHADNPVHWWEWGSGAFAEATERDVPVFLSVGYSACHWCHVMAHESFEDEDTARFLNDRFVSIKVDREERPDVDRIYMDAVTATTGHGGWPMTVFLTSDAKPFYAGTYFPKERRHGMPPFMDVLRAIDDAWTHRREGLIGRSDEITRLIAGRSVTPSVAPSVGEIELAVDAIAATFDPSNGGFGRAPKFPQPSTLEFLLRFGVLRPDSDRSETALAMVETTLDRMARGGIYDHLDGGFARYSVDDRWLVPHFEKMLYDNALLARLYLRAWQVFGQSWMLETARETLDYLAGDMIDPSGGIHSAEDADAEGREGSFAVWSWDELVEVLGDDLDAGAAIYGATPEGNFEGANILHLPDPLMDIAARFGVTEDELRQRKKRIDGVLRERRSRRVHPDRDDKVVAAWNGLALRAFAEAAAILDSDRYMAVAEGIAAFLTGPALRGDRLLRSWRRGRGGPDGFCDDYGAAAIGLFALYQATGEERWYRHAEQFTQVMVDQFADDSGGFFATAADADPLIARPKNVHDNPTPSDNALAAEALSILAAFTGSAEAYGRFERTVESVGPALTTHPWAHGHLLGVWLANPVLEIAVVGELEARRPFLEAVWGRFRPGTVVAVGDGIASAVPLLERRSAPGAARAFVCRGLVCDLPADSPGELSVQLDPL
ncbi:MAG: thioredoxin domain-containing protein [Actinomycetota bacterium]|nr:thioredoxin domain-containing protein [Actinomycetota bacterium]